jgi:hypothetical protein
MNRIDGYLNEMSWAMGGSFAEQQAARDEIRAHIREHVRELQLEGVDEPGAIDRALADLGSPETLGRSMRGSRGKTPLQRALIQPEGALILERRREQHMPPARVLLALGAFVLVGFVVSLVYVWP